MSGPCTVVIGAPHLLEALRSRAAADGEVLAFTDADAVAALQAITIHRPPVVTLERLFAATSRGAALINRIKADPDLAFAEIRVVSHDGEYSRVSPRRTGMVVETVDASGAAAPPLDWRGTRRAPRFRLVEGTEAQIDNAPASLVDLSVNGAQVLVQGPLKPNQRVRVTLADDAGVVRLNGDVAWASFESAKGVTRYRAGIEFTDAKPTAVDAFVQRHKQNA
jgi:hypothetical protein